MKEFLTKDPIKLNDEELYDLQKRKDMDEKRVEEQKKFYEVARQRAKELDVYMERFRRDIVESSMFFPVLRYISADECRQMASQSSLPRFEKRIKSMTSVWNTRSLPNGCE